jgi:hypothetical protein
VVGGQAALPSLTPRRTGRALAILPRGIAEHGYTDMEIDDEKEGGFIKTLIEKVNNVSVRVNKKTQESEEVTRTV